MDELLNFFNRFFPNRNPKQINEITAQNSINSVKQMGKSKQASNTISKPNIEKQEKSVFPSIDVNLEYMKNKLNYDRNSDISINEFTVLIQDREFKAFIVYVDGLINLTSLYDFVIKPLTNTKVTGETKEEGKDSGVRIINSGVASNISVRRIRKFNLESYIYNLLMPQNKLLKISDFDKILSYIYSGNCMLFIDTLPIAYSLDMSIYTMDNTFKYNFCHLLKNNTSVIRSLINNPNLIIEEESVGKITNTKISLCYLSNKVDSKTLFEIKDRINTLEIDSVLSSSDLKKYLKIKKWPSREILSTNNPSNVIKSILNGKIAIVINGTSYVLVMQGKSFNQKEKKKKQTNISNKAAMLTITILMLIFSSYFTNTNATNLVNSNILEQIELSNEEKIYSRVISNTLKEGKLIITNPYENSAPLEVSIYRSKNTKNEVEIINDSPFISSEVSLLVKVNVANDNLFFLNDNLKQYIQKYLHEQILDYLYKTARDIKIDINNFSSSFNKMELNNIDWKEKYINSFFDLDLTCDIQIK